jgi:LysR family transcriptional regulator, regulator for bpeEF and oprC
VEQSARGYGGMTHGLDDTLAFVKVVQEGSFTAAARSLGLPKATVSRKVQDLEQRLGAQLLHRTTRRVGLTEAGAIYFQYCESIARTLTEAEIAVSQMQGEPRGWLRITSSYSLSVSLLSPLISEFRSVYPGVLIDLTLTHETLDLISREIDVALRMGPLPDSSLAARKLAVFPNRIYASRDYLAQHGEPAHPDDLRRHLALATRVAQRSRGFAWPMSDGGDLQDYEINPVIIADDPDALIQPLLSGQGLMMVTDVLVKPYLAKDLIQPVLAGWTGRRPELHAVFPQGRVQSPKLRVFLDFLLARLKILLR